MRMQNGHAARRARSYTPSGGEDAERGTRKAIFHSVTVPGDLARKLAAIRERIVNDLDKRDTLIVEAVKAGGSLREVGELVGLTHAGVRDVVRRKG